MPEGGNIPPGGPNDRSAAQDYSEYNQFSEAQFRSKAIHLLERIAAALEAK